MKRKNAGYKKISAFILALLMVLSCFDTGVYALEEEKQGSIVTENAPECEEAGEEVAINIDEAAVMETQEENTAEKQEETAADEAITADSVSDNTLSENDITEIPMPGERYYGFVENDFEVDMPADGSLDTGSGAEDDNTNIAFENAYSQYSDDLLAGEEEVSADTASKEITVPSKYTLDDNLYVSSVKDQGAWGTCWSFMAMAAAESAYMIQNPGDQKNLSETQMVRYFYNGYYNEDVDRFKGDGTLRNDRIYPKDNVRPVMMGGNGDYTTFALARWTGAADEAYDPSLSYPDAKRTGTLKDISVSKGLAYDADVEHLQNAYWIDLNNRNDVKKAIMTYGAVGLAYYSYDGYGSDYYRDKVNPSYKGPAVYFNSEKTDSNHEVVIVGWDDDFSRNNFKYTYNNYANEKKGLGLDLPSSNGAWLIKNSEGSSCGDNGFVWISYEDASIDKPGKRVYAFDFEPADNYTHNYQYDGSCYTAQKVYPYAAAVYTASSDQWVEAVGVGFASSDNEYTVSVYTDLTDQNNPESGTLVSRKTGTTSYPGFYTILLDDFACIGSGSKFSVVVRSRTKNNGFTSFFVDSSYNYGNGYRFSADVSNDMTFSRTENGSWLSTPSRDLCTLRIKAYSNDRGPEKKKLTDFSVDLPHLTYNGADRTEELCDALVIMDDGKVLRDTHYDFKFDRTPCEAGVYKLTVSGRNDYEGSRTFDFSIGAAKLADKMVTLEYTSAFYKGVPIEPRVNIDAGRAKASSLNYYVEYADNINCGTATVKVTGRNSLSGNVTLSFKIDKCPVSLATVDVDLETYTGKPIIPGIMVTLGGYVLKGGEDYTAAFSNNVNASSNAVVKITGRGNFTGIKEQTFMILAKKASGSVSIAGKAGTAEVTLKYKNEVLSPSCYDIRIYYGKKETPVDKFEAGKTYTVKGNFKGNYSGSFIVKNVKVYADISGYTLTLKGGTSVTYNGKAFKPKVTVADKQGNIVPSGGYEVKYSNNTNAGTATVTVKGKGLYTGSISTGFKINPAVIAPSMVTAIKDQKYTGKAITPKLSVKGLKAGRDYNIEYRNNVNVSYDANGSIIKGAQAVIKPTSNFVLAQGFDGVCYYKILPISMSSLSVKEGYFRGNGNQVLPSSVTVKAGSIILNSGNYNIFYSNNTTVTNKAVVTVAAKARGNFTGSRSTKYKIVREKLNSKTMKYSGLGDRKYTGGRICPVITVTNYYGETLQNGKDYVVTYGKNVNPGKGTVKITAVKNGRYEGSVTKTFKITK